MTTKEGLTTVGVVTDRNHKDGKKQDGTVWNRYSFQINGHWYSSFAEDVWRVLEKGKCFKVYYSEKGNLKGGAPYRTVEWMEAVEVEPATAVETQAQPEQPWETPPAEYRQPTGQDALQQRIAWNSAINNATNLLAYSSNLQFDHTTEEEILKWAAWYYQAIIAGPPSAMPAEAPSEAAETPEVEEPSPAPAPAQQASFEALSRLNGARQAGMGRNQWKDDREYSAAVLGYAKRYFGGRTIPQLSDAEVDQVAAAVRERKL